MSCEQTILFFNLFLAPELVFQRQCSANPVSKHFVLSAHMTEPRVLHSNNTMNVFI